MSAGRPLLLPSVAVQVTLGVAPLALIFIAFLLGWVWRQQGWPTILELPLPYLAILALVTGGALEGVRRGAPPWSYSWLAQGLQGLALLGGVLLITVAGPDRLVSGAAGGAYAWTFLGFHQLWVLLALGGALLLTHRSQQDALFFFALFAGAKAVTFPVLIGVVLQASATGVTGALAAVAVCEGLAMTFLVHRFLTGHPLSWRPFWGLCGLVLLDSPLKLWPVLLQMESIGHNLRQMGKLLAETWFLDVGFLVVAVLSVRVFLALRGRST